MLYIYKQTGACCAQSSPATAFKKNVFLYKYFIILFCSIKYIYYLCSVIEKQSWQPAKGHGGDGEES